MTVIGTIIDCMMQLFIPWIVLLLNILHIPSTIWRLVKTGESRKLLSFSGFRAAWFANFWATITPSVKRSYKPYVVALLEGRVRHGRIHDSVVSKPISGVVLEIGAGAGNWADVLAAFVQHETSDSSPTGSNAGMREAASKVNAPDSSATPGRYITKIYGIEPNPVLANSLRERATELNMGDRYRVASIGIEQILDCPEWQEKIPEKSVDSIICICCLCSIPNPKETIHRLYKLLKPGGRWYIHEHVQATRGGLFMKLYQYFLGFFYSPLMGGCKICRPTLSYILAAGGFSEVDIEQPPVETSYTVFPRIIGTCTV